MSIGDFLPALSTIRYTNPTSGRRSIFGYVQSLTMAWFALVAALLVAMTTNLQAQIIVDSEGKQIWRRFSISVYNIR